MTDELIKLLQKDLADARVMCGNRWMYWLDSLWVVREDKPYQKKAKVVYVGDSLEEALKLLDEEYSTEPE